MRIVFERLEHALQPLFEVAAIFGAGQQCAHIQRINRGLGQHLRHVFIDDTARQAFGYRGFADAGFAHQQRVVLAATAKDLNDTFQLAIAANQWVDFALLRQGVEINGVLFQRAVLCLVALFGIAIFALRFGTVTGYF